MQMQINPVIQDRLMEKSTNQVNLTLTEGLVIIKPDLKSHTQELEVARKAEKALT